MEEAIARIQSMERLFDEVCAARKKRTATPELKKKMDLLERYMTGGGWLCDYELDEAGLLPKDLKRGVLSQDTLYNLLQEIKDEENGR